MGGSRRRLVAGVGFVLERVIDRGGVKGLISGATAGLLVVAGPWVISTGTLFFLSAFLNTQAPRFFTLVVYSYAGTLVLFGGYHYRFTRLLADYLYAKNFKALREGYYRGLLVATIAGLPPALAVGWWGGWRGVGMTVPVLLYLAVNLSWIHTLFSSLLQDFAAVTWAYTVGTLTIVAAILIRRGADIDATYAAQVFAAGLLATGAFLWVAIERTLRRREQIAARRPRIATPGRIARSSLIRLSAIGWGLGTVLWLDKVVYWFVFGGPASGSALPLFPVYDQAVFIAQLFLIPAMVVFVIRVETTFFRGLRTVLRALQKGTHLDLDGAREVLKATYNHALSQQIAVQLFMVVAIALLSPEIVRFAGIQSVDMLIVAGVAAQVYFLFYTLLINLLYLADYRAAARVVLLTAALSGLLAPLLAWAYGVDSVGYAFLFSSFGGVVMAWIAGRRGLRDFDWLVLTRFNA